MIQENIWVKLQLLLLLTDYQQLEMLMSFLSWKKERLLKKVIMILSWENTLMASMPSSLNSNKMQTKELIHKWDKENLLMKMMLMRNLKFLLKRRSLKNKKINQDQEHKAMSELVLNRKEIKIQKNLRKKNSWKKKLIRLMNKKRKKINNLWKN